MKTAYFVLWNGGEFSELLRVLDPTPEAMESAIRGVEFDISEGVLRGPVRVAWVVYDQPHPARKRHLTLQRDGMGQMIALPRPAVHSKTDEQIH